MLPTSAPGVKMEHDWNNLEYYMQYMYIYVYIDMYLFLLNHNLIFLHEFHSDHGCRVLNAIELILQYSFYFCAKIF